MDTSIPFGRNVGNEPTDYISITNGEDDALCILYISLTQLAGDNKI